MKKLSRFLAILAVFALSLGLMSALAEEQDMQRQYDDAVQRLGKYLLNLKQEPVDIAVEDDPAPAETSAVQSRDEGGEQE